MASTDDILTTQKNGVVAVNNLSQSLKLLYDHLVYVGGESTSLGLAASASVTTSPGRLVRLNVVVAGTTSGKAYDYVTGQITTVTTSGTNATVNVPGVTFAVGDTVVISGATPSTLDGTYTAIAGSGSGVVVYANTTPAAPLAASSGTAFISSNTRAICAIPNTIGVFEVGAQFAHGLYIALGTGQVVSATYSTD